MRRPDSKGYFGEFGGKFVPETLQAALSELDRAYSWLRKDKQFTGELRTLLTNYAGRPSPLYFARRLSAAWGGAKVYLKREDLNHTGSHKINNCLGQALLARRLGKKRVVAETGAGQHGVATATACALLGLKCVVYMGTVDMARQKMNVEKMEILGARVVPVDSGTRTLKDAINEAIRDWVTNVRTTHYLLGSTVGPHPYPVIVRNFQSIIGRETRRQIMRAEGSLPDVIIACVGGGSNALGIFYPFLPKKSVRLIGVEAYGRGTAPGQHGASISFGTPGVLHGAYSFLLQDDCGQVLGTHSVSAGLDYPGVGPEHSMLSKTGRVEYTGVSDAEALEAFHELARLEGILPALEPAHALAHARKVAAGMSEDSVVIVNLSGRGDKDMETVLGYADSE